MYANVIIQYGNKAVDREFTYMVPSSLVDKIRVGHRVRVLFNNREIEGFVLSLNNQYDGEYELNEIISLVDDEPIIKRCYILVINYVIRFYVVKYLRIK